MVKSLIEKKSKFSLFILIIASCISSAQNPQFEDLCKGFIKDRELLNLADLDLDYKTNFTNIKSIEELSKQEKIFSSYLEKIRTATKLKLTDHEQIRLLQLSYECDLNLERIKLEKKWNADGRKIPEGGLFTINNNKEWYSYIIKLFTSVDITPEKVFEYGQSEVNRIKKEISETKDKLGFKTDKDFYNYLQRDTFFISDKNTILKKYALIDSTVRQNYKALFPEYTIPVIGVMEWPNAGPNTPPGIYLNNSSNPYGKDVFQYNFYGSKHNVRCMEWLYMHEAIPGHHFQYYARTNLNDEPLKNQYFYFGNAEGWACYIEDYGKNIGLYYNPYSYVGKLQWDLVRSSRLVMEVGIHYFGWSFDKAMKYWKENIIGQDDIAEREIKRITNWAGQALCYKIGAKILKEITALKRSEGVDIKIVHAYMLDHGDVPLQCLFSFSKSKKQ